MQAKLMSLTQATELIKDDMLLAMGGNAMHRNPVLFAAYRVSRGSLVKTYWLWM